MNKRLSAVVLVLVTLMLGLQAFQIRGQEATETFEDPESGVRYRIEQVTLANYPVALAFSPDGRLFYTEKTTGSVRVIDVQGTLQREPVITLPVDALVERGLLGIALDPTYEETGSIWVYHTAPGDARNYPANTIVRFREADGVGSDPEAMMTFPIETGTLIHNGGNLRFDDEGYLYVSIGDYDVPANAQDLTVAQGKIHRFEVTDDGLAVPEDNPIDGSSIYAYGLRNPFDFAFDPISGRIFATENGDACDDEINLILPGFHYGQGENYQCGRTAVGVDLGRYFPPLISITPTEAPTGIVIYDHRAIPEWRGKLFYCTWSTGRIVMVTLDEDRTGVEETRELDTGEARCRIDIEVGPEGGLYFTSVSEASGAIYRLLPSE
jgi:glucose/arabinose dehydrogenase